MKKTLCWFLYICFFGVLSGCIRSLEDCAGPPLDINKIAAIRNKNLEKTGVGYLVLPNPIDATNNALANATDSAVAAASRKINLPSLISSSSLDNNFLKIRLTDLNDNSNPAQPNSSGEYNYPVSDVRYSQVMTYHGVNLMTANVEALGFSVMRNRNLYVMVTAQDPTDPSLVNAYYQNNIFDPNLPREILFYGNGPFAPAKDADVIMHEMGHFINQGLARGLGFDIAGNYGARTEAGALEECTADYFTESLQGRGYIAKWINRNFSTTPGTPLRSAVELNDGKSDFKSVSTFSASSGAPKKYEVAEWCTRVLYRFENYLKAESPEWGPIIADRLVMKAVSSLQQDAGISDFAKALIQADQSYHCGLHEHSIREAFQHFGFNFDPPKLSNPLTLKATPVSYQGETAFNLEITNSNSQTARNVRVKLEALSTSFITDIYLQNFGDLSAGQKVTVGAGGISLDYSVTGQKDPLAAVPARYRLTVLVENGSSSSVEGVVP